MYFDSPYPANTLIFRKPEKEVIFSSFLYSNFVSPEGSILDTPETSYGFRGNPKNPWESPRILAESLRILRNPMLFTPLNPWEPENPRESPRILRNPRESPRILRNPLESPGILWNPENP